MAKRPRKPRPTEQLAEYRERSGWWLAAWRDFRGLSLEDLVDAVGYSKSVISDLETGATRSNGKVAQRYNRDHVEAFTRALEITEGNLFNMDPFVVDHDLEDISHNVHKLGKRERTLLKQFMGTLTGTER